MNTEYNIALYGIIVSIIVIFIIFRRYKHKTMHTSSSGSQKSTPQLNMYGTDFTQTNSQNNINTVIGRDNEILRLTQILSRRSKNNAILIGPPGVGKTAIVEGLAQRIITNNVPDVLLNKRVIALEITSLMAGTKYRGDFEQRAKLIVKEIQASERNIILFIDEIHTLIQTQGTEGAVNFADILKPALARGDLQLIGATTFEEYEKYIKSDSSLERRFQIIEVKEPTDEETFVILQGIKDKFVTYHNVEFTDAALRAASQLTKNKLKSRKLPDKAIDAIDEAAAMVKVHHIHSEIPTLLLSAAAKKNPEIVALWQDLQTQDMKRLQHKKKKLSITAAEKKLSEFGILVVDSADVEAVIKEWYD